MDWMRTTAFKIRSVLVEDVQDDIEDTDPNFAATKEYIASLQARLHALNLQLQSNAG